MGGLEQFEDWLILFFFIIIIF